MNMVSVSDLASAAAAIAVTVGIALALQQLRDLRKVREGEVVLKLQESLTGALLEDLWMVMRFEYDDYKDFKVKYSGKREETAFLRVGVFFEGLGVLVRRGIVPLRLVDDFFHGVTLAAWKKSEKAIQGYREEHNWKEFEEQFEYLYGRVKSFRESTAHPEIKR